MLDTYVTLPYTVFDDFLSLSTFNNLVRSCCLVELSIMYVTLAGIYKICLFYLLDYKTKQQLLSAYDVICV